MKVASAMLPDTGVSNDAAAVKTAIAAAGAHLACRRYPWGPETEIDKETLACRGYGFYEGTPEFVLA